MKRCFRRLRLAACGVVAILQGHTNALAEYHHRVLLLERENSADADHEITTRVRAELGAAGFDVIVLRVAEEDPKLAVEDAGHELHPASVLLVERLLPSAKGQGGGAELWLADRMLKKTVVLRLKPADREPRASDVDAVNSHEAARVAVQAVELVKARLAELAVTREHEPAAPTTPPAAPKIAPKPRELRGAHPNLTLGAGLLEGFQDGQQSVSPVLRLGVALPERWTGEILALDVRAGFVGLGRAARIEHGPGAATLRHTAATLDAVVRFLPRRHVQPFLSLGGGMLAIDVAGATPDPYRNDSGRTLSGLLNASGGIWLQPVRGVGLVLEGQLMEAWSKTVVRIAGQDAAEVAAPLLFLSGGLMAEF